MTTNRLTDLLCYVAKNVPFYSALSARPRLELDDFPVLHKRHYIENLDDLLSVEYANYERTTETSRWNDPQALLCEFTSGSSGYPLRCYKTASERAELGLSLFKKRRAIWSKFTPDQLYCFIHNTEIREQTYLKSLGNLTDANIATVLTYLRDEKRPAALHGNTMLLQYYADFIRRHDFDLRGWRIEFIESVGESINEVQKQFIGQSFKSEVFNCYGCLECYNVAYECPYHTLHLNENVLVEVLDPGSGLRLKDSTADGEFTLTSLVNHCQPFVRYKMGDLGKIVDCSCPCGSRCPTVQLSERRKIDYVKLLYKIDDAALNICGYDLFSAIMYRLVTGGHDYVSWYNVVQTDLFSFQVLFARKPGFSSKFCELFQQYTDNELGHKTVIEFIEKREEEILHINQKNRLFRSLLQAN